MTEQPAGVAEPGNNKRPGWLAILTVLNAALLLILWIVENNLAERVRFLVWLTYVPQQPAVIPTLVLLLWSMFARRWRLGAANLAVAAAVLVTFMGFNVPLGASSGTRDKAFRILTLNTRVGINGVDRIIRLVDQYRPDILCLQETRAWRDNPDPLPPIVRRLPGWYLERAGDVATLSRHRIELVAAHPMLPEMDRAALQTRIHLPQGSVTVFNVHFNTNYRRRPANHPPGMPRLSLRALARWEQAEIVLKAAETVDGPVLTAGDFNNPPRGLVYRRLAQRFTDSFRAAGWGFGYTFRSDLPLMRIDYIWANPRIGITTAREIHSNASDHRAVVADLWIR